MEEVLKALEALAAKFDTFIAESKAASDAARAAEADADAAEEEKVEAVEAYAAAAKAVADAELLPSQEKTILEAAKRGDDIAPLIESAKAVVDEAKKAVAEKAPGYVIESERKSDDFTITQTGDGWRVPPNPTPPDTPPETRPGAAAAGARPSVSAELLPPPSNASSSW